MPILPNTNSSDLTFSRQARTNYANYIIRKQSVDHGCAINMKTNSILSSDISILKQGALLITNQEQSAILEANKCISTTLEEIYAIPNFTNTMNTYTVGSIEAGTEPATYQCVVTNVSEPFVNGTYTTTGSSFYYGDYTQYAPYLCFKRDSIGYWTTRTGRNNYSDEGNYGTINPINSTVISGSVVNGEWLTITAPYSFVLSSYSLVTGIHNTLPINSWVIAGSLDGGRTYTTVDVQTGITTGTNTFKLPSNTTAYSTYKIVITKINTSYIAGAEIDSWNLFRYVLKSN